MEMSTRRGRLRFRDLFREPSDAEVRERLRDIHAGRPLLNRSDYNRRLKLARLYSILWVGVLLAGLWLLPGWWKLAVAAFCALVAPSWRDLTKRYDEYRAEWLVGNPSEWGDEWESAANDDLSLNPPIRLAQSVRGAHENNLLSRQKAADEAAAA
jgi:hypothetical protein